MKQPTNQHYYARFEAERKAMLTDLEKIKAAVAAAEETWKVVALDDLKYPALMFNGTMITGDILERVNNLAQPERRI